MMDHARLFAQALATRLSSLGAAALDLVFPPLEPCTLCRGPLSIASEVRVCPACLDKLGRIEGPRCDRCGRRLGADAPAEKRRALAPWKALGSAFRRGRPERLCHQCRTVPSALDAARAYSTYDGYMRAVIHSLKYRGDLLVARGLGELMAWVVAVDPVFEGVKLIVPVPLHPKRLKERGYNQAAELAWVIGEQLGLPVAEALARVRETQPQAALSWRERLRNTAHAFEAVRPEAVRGKDVLIVDDVYTTGATASSAALALKRAGGRRVTGVFAAAGSLERDLVARRPPDSFDFGEPQGLFRAPKVPGLLGTAAVDAAAERRGGAMTNL